MTHDKLTEFFEGFDAVMKVSLGTLVKLDAMFYLAIFLVLQWHVRKYLANWKVIRDLKECYPYVKEYFDDPSETVKRIGLNIWILQFYYDQEDPPKNPTTQTTTTIQPTNTNTTHYDNMPLRWLVDRQPFEWTIFLIFFDSVVLNLMFNGIGWALNKIEEKLNGLKEPLLDDQETETDTQKGGLPATNLYMDITAPIGHVFMTMCIQLGLLGLYVEHLNVDPTSHYPSKVNYGYWLVGLLIQLFAADTALGSPLDLQWWWHLLGSPTWSKPLSMLRKPDDEANLDVRQISYQRNKIGCVSLQYKYLWLARFVMDWFVNGFGRTIILLTFPIMLCVEGNIDFVKDCMGIFFITQLDDIETKEWVELMVRIKIRIAYQAVPTNDIIVLGEKEKEHVKEEMSKEYGDKYDNLRKFLKENPEEKYERLHKFFSMQLPE